MSWSQLHVVLAQALPEDVAAECIDFQDGSLALCEMVAAVVPNAFLARTLATLIPSALRIFVILVAAWVLNRLARRLIRRFVLGLTETGLERLGSMRGRTLLASTEPVNLKRATMRTETIGAVFRSLATVAIWTVALLMILGEVGVNLGPLIAGAGIIGVALGFGSQRLVQDFLSGIFMLLEDQYGVGDIVDVGEATGVVEGISLRTTRVRDVYGVVWHVPNGEIHRIGNMSQLWSRAVLDVGVAYDTDLDHAASVIERVALDLHADREWSADFIDAPEMWGVQELGENEVKLRLVVKVVPARQWAVERELRARLKKAFDAEGIEIPFPQRVVWVRRDGDGEAPTDRAGAEPTDRPDAESDLPGAESDPGQEGTWGPALGSLGDDRAS